MSGGDVTAESLTSLAVLSGDVGDRTSNSSSLLLDEMISLRSSCVTSGVDATSSGDSLSAFFDSGLAP